jgi:hypothetical protein
METDCVDDQDSDSEQETVENNNDDNNGSDYDIDSDDDVDDGMAAAEKPSDLIHDPNWTAEECYENEQNYSEEDDDEETEEYQSKSSRNEVRYTTINCRYCVLYNSSRITV